ncbi:MAG: radical SAM protein [Deltaproteobacteria bacterium]|nr:MAG: radical SAM protein [Deltaproteobacteria bacterium]
MKTMEPAAPGTKNILFIIPPFFHIRDYTSGAHTSQIPVLTIPYGVLSLAAYLKANAHCEIQTRIVDLNFEAFRLCNNSADLNADLKAIIKDNMFDFQPDIVGISALFNTCYNHLGLISDSVNDIDSDALLVIGGGLATNLSKEILTNFRHIEACCYGEGEIPLRQLVNADAPHQYLRSNSSWITRESLQEGRKPQHNFVQNLDEIPFFDYGLINLNNYMGRSLDKSYSQQSLREISIHTSRGCPFRCVYCSNGTVHGKKVRFMSVGKVIDEVESMVNLYGVKVLLIEDDHFLSNKERAKQILKKLSDFNLKIEFPNGIAVYGIDEDIGKLLKAAGVTTISLAVESGSDFVLKNIIHKPLRVASIKPAVEILRKNGISVHAFIVLGLPGELEQHREETMQMILDVGFDWVKFFIALPIAGSKLYDICKDNGYLVNDDFSDLGTIKAYIRTPDLDPEYMEDRVYLMNLEANFVRNFMLRSGNFRRAALHFENIANRYPNHAFAHYYLVKANEGLGGSEELNEYHQSRFRELVATDSNWGRYARHFDLPVS